MQCAEYELTRLKDRGKALKTLAEMETRFPSTVFPMALRYRYELACLYRDCGALEKASPIFSVLENRFRLELRDSRIDRDALNSPLRYLLEMYEHDKQYSKALAVLDTVQKQHSDDPSIIKKRLTLLSEMKNNLNIIVN